MKSDKISLFNNPRSKLTYFYTPFVYIKHGGPFCKFLGPSVLASIFLKKTDFSHNRKKEHFSKENTRLFRTSQKVRKIVNLNRARQSVSPLRGCTVLHILLLSQKTTKNTHLEF